MSNQKGKKKGKGGFQSLNLSPPVFKGIMNMGYRIPTPVQRKSLPVSLTGADTVVMARTGSGKTAAFLIPIFERLKEHSTKMGARAIILSPSRELALQTLSFAKKMGKFMNLRFSFICGGESIDNQFQSLAGNPDILVATPGRLVHLLQEIPNFSLGTVEVIVFDEADRLFEMGFADQLHQILRTIPPERRQSLLFSATMPRQLVQFARAGLRDPVLIRLDLEQKVSETLKVAFFLCKSNDKPACLLFLLRELIPLDEMTVIFTATRHHAEYIRLLLVQGQYKSSIIYGSMDQESRKENLEDFRYGRRKILIVTDVAARGIDVPLLNNVINYSFPPLPKLFVHRVGRAARQGRIGVAYSLVEPDEIPYMIDLHLFLGRPLGVCEEAKGYSLKDMTPETIHYGSFPQQILDEENESLKEMAERGGLSSDVTMLSKVADNAMKQFKRTRPDASKRAVVRAKEIDWMAVHPLLAKFSLHGMADRAAAEEMRSYIKAMANFRPKETIFEVIGGEGQSAAGKIMESVRNAARVKNLLNRNIAADNPSSVPQIENKALMPLSRAVVTGEITEEHDERSNFQRKATKRHCKAVLKRLKKAKKKGMDIDEQLAPPLPNAKPKEKEASENAPSSSMGKFADPENYMGYGTNEANEMAEGAMQPRSNEKKQDCFLSDRLDEAMMEVNPDEAIEIVKKQRIMHWDTKKKNFVKSSIAEMREGKKYIVRNDAGVTVELKGEKRGEIYGKWKQRSKMDIAREGEEENPLLTTSVRGKRRNMRTTVVNPNAKSELRSAEQIRKNRAKEEGKKFLSLPKAKRKLVVQKKRKEFLEKKAQQILASNRRKTRSRAIIRV